MTMGAEAGMCVLETQCTHLLCIQQPWDRPMQCRGWAAAICLIEALKIYGQCLISQFWGHQKVTVHTTLNMRMVFVA